MITIQKLNPLSGLSKSVTSPQESEENIFRCVSSSEESKFNDSDYSDDLVQLSSTPLGSKFKLQLHVPTEKDVRRVLREISGCKVETEKMTNEQQQHLLQKFVTGINKSSLLLHKKKSGTETSSVKSLKKAKLQPRSEIGKNFRDAPRLQIEDKNTGKRPQQSQFKPITVFDSAFFSVGDQATIDHAVLPSNRYRRKTQQNSVQKLHNQKQSELSKQQQDSQESSMDQNLDQSSSIFTDQNAHTLKRQSEEETFEELSKFACQNLIKNFEVAKGDVQSQKSSELKIKYNQSQLYQTNEQLEIGGYTDFRPERKSVAMINARKTLALPELVEVASVGSTSLRLNENQILLSSEETLIKTSKLPSSTMASATDFQGISDYVVDNLTKEIKAQLLQTSSLRDHCSDDHLKSNIDQRLSIKFCHKKSFQKSTEELLPKHHFLGEQIDSEKPLNKHQVFAFKSSTSNQKPQICNYIPSTHVVKAEKQSAAKRLKLRNQKPGKYIIKAMNKSQEVLREQHRDSL